MRFDPRAWPVDWGGWTDALALVECAALAGAPPSLRPGSLPPFPLIGIGHPGIGCERLDAAVPDLAAARRLARRVRANPRAAAVAVQVLRMTENMPVEDALTVESLAFATLQGSAEFSAWLERRPAPAPVEPGDRLMLAHDGATLAIRLERTDRHNAIDAAMRDALHDAFTLAALNPAITRVTLDAAGRCFSTGGDLAEFGITRDPAEAHRIRGLTLPARALLPRASVCEVLVHGACIGAGLELAAFAGHVAATPDAWFQLPELAMGLIPGAGGCVSLPRRIGRQRTASMLLTGRRIDAATALRWGLIDAIVDRPST